MKHSRPYPLFLDLSERPALVVGGGGVGLRKARGLAECGARVTVVSLAFAAEFRKVRGVELVERGYGRGVMREKKWRVVFAATDSAEVNGRVMKDAAAAGILCSRADVPEEGDFAGGATVFKEGVTIAVSTGGASPGLGVRICREAAEGMDPVLTRWAGLLVGWRPALKAGIPVKGIRRVLLQRLAGEEMEKILRRGGVAAARKAYKEWVQEAKRMVRERHAD